MLKGITYLEICQQYAFFHRRIPKQLSPVSAKEHLGLRISSSLL